MLTVQSEPRNIFGLLFNALSGTLQLPNFQRLFVWDKEEIVNFADSLLNNYYIGLLLVAGNMPPSVRTVALTGVEWIWALCSAIKTSQPSLQLLMDGQQRLTTFLCLLYNDFFAFFDEKNPPQIVEWWQEKDGKRISALKNLWQNFYSSNQLPKQFSYLYVIEFKTNELKDALKKGGGEGVKEVSRIFSKGITFISKIKIPRSTASEFDLWVTLWNKGMVPFYILRDSSMLAVFSQCSGGELKLGASTFYDFTKCLIERDVISQAEAITLQSALQRLSNLLFSFSNFTHAVVLPSDASGAYPMGELAEIFRRINKSGIELDDFDIAVAIASGYEAAGKNKIKYGGGVQLREIYNEAGRYIFSKFGSLLNGAIIQRTFLLTKCRRECQTSSTKCTPFRGF